MSQRPKWWRAIAALVVLLAPLPFLVGAFVEAHSTPLVRRVALERPDWPKGQPPVTMALLSDLHVGWPSRSPEDLARIAAQVDALHPDLILIAGDFLAGHRARTILEDETLLAPLSNLHAPLGVVAVLGNHDYWGAGARLVPVLERHGVTVLRNAAVARGPLAIAGVDDPVTGHDEVETAVRAVRALPGARVVLAHSPEVVDELPPDLGLLLAGHTHCGQVRLPFFDPNGPHWPYIRYECGVVRDPGRTVVVSAGIGTSVAPLRLGAPPDFWLITLGGPGMKP